MRCCLRVGVCGEAERRGLQCAIWGRLEEIPSSLTAKAARWCATCTRRSREGQRTWSLTPAGRGARNHSLLYVIILHHTRLALQGNSLYALVATIASIAVLAIFERTQATL